MHPREATKCNIDQGYHLSMWLKEEEILLKGNRKKPEKNFELLFVLCAKFGAHWMLEEGNFHFKSKYFDLIQIIQWINFKITWNPYIEKIDDHGQTKDFQT